MTQSALLNWFETNPDISQLVVGVFDYNGVLRGKRMPIAKLATIAANGFKMPLSILQTDIWGQDIEDSPLVFETGDGDGHVALIERVPLRLDWMAEPTALLIGRFVSNEGSGDGISGHEACPRSQLATSLAHLASQDMHIMAGVEMEFYLLADEDHKPQSASSSVTGKAVIAGDTLSAHHLDDFDQLLSEITSLCATQNITIDTITSELGIGQFEITFAPKNDLLCLADDILIFKYLVKGLAKARAIRASFMAKPLTGQAGNGMHIHASLLNQAGDNLFHDDDAAGAMRLSQAVAGIMQVMRDTTLILAPHINSYRRLVPASHAPTKICWGMDNRTAAIRIPASPPAARRLEYRSAGADCNPYLLFAILAGSMARGFDEALAPPPPITGNAYEQDIDDLPYEMGEALALFHNSEAVRTLLGPVLQSYYSGTKQQEWRCFAEHVSAFEFASLSNNL